MFTSSYRIFIFGSNSSRLFNKQVARIGPSTAEIVIDKKNNIETVAYEEGQLEGEGSRSDSASSKSISSRSRLLNSDCIVRGAAMTTGRSTRSRSHHLKRGKTRDSWGKSKFLSYKSSTNENDERRGIEGRKAISHRGLLRSARWKRKNSHELAWVKIVEAEKLQREM